MISWSMHAPDDVARLRALSGCEDVLLVSTDGAQVRSRICPFLHAQGIDLPVAADPDSLRWSPSPSSACRARASRRAMYQ